MNEDRIKQLAISYFCTIQNENKALEFCNLLLNSYDQLTSNSICTLKSIAASDVIEGAQNLDIEVIATEAIVDNINAYTFLKSLHKLVQHLKVNLQQYEN